MYFNYPTFLPPWLEENIREASDYLDQVGDELKIDARKSFQDIPFNLVDEESFKRKIDELKVYYLKCSAKAKVLGKDRPLVPLHPWDDSFSLGYQDAIRETFVSYPFSLLVKKGISSGGKEILVSPEEEDLAVFFFRTVYPLCLEELDKNKFPIAQHPIYPLFHRYMQEPLAIAMTLAAVDRVIANDWEVGKRIRHRIQCLSRNYSAGIYLYESGLYKRWKDWRDDCKRCLGKIEIMVSWISLLSNYSASLSNEELIRIWGQLFDLSIVDVQGLIAAAKYAPVIAEDENLSNLILGLFKYAVNNPDVFRNGQCRSSRNPIAIVINRLIYNYIDFDEAVSQIPANRLEDIIREFIGNDMPGWSFAKDLHTGCFRIYGPAIGNASIANHPH